MTPGRPRDPGVDRRIARAALDLFADAGWAGFAMEAVARRADLARSTGAYAAQLVGFLLRAVTAA